MTELNFKTAFMFPFNRAKGMLNILWLLLPIFGWFALIGYGVRIIQGFIKGKFQELPKLSFTSDMKLGFWMFLKAIPFILVYGVVFYILEQISVGLSNAAKIVVDILITPILTVNFLQKETVAAYFDFAKLQVVFNNFADYIVAFLKSLLLAIIFLIMWVVLVGIPAGAFTQNIFIADFYRRRVIGEKSSAKKVAKRVAKKSTRKKSAKKATKKKAKK